MPTQLTLQERAVLETLLRSKTSPTNALAKINKSRVNKGIAETTLNTILRLFSGVTHKRGRSERRGPRGMAPQRAKNAQPPQGHECPTASTEARRGKSLNRPLQKWLGQIP